MAKDGEKAGAWAVASWALWGVVGIAKDAAGAVLEVGRKYGADAVEVTKDVASPYFAKAAGVAAAGIEEAYCIVTVKAKRIMLPSSLEARIPGHWRGLGFENGAPVQAVPVSWEREILEKALEPGGSLGGRDLVYKHPEGYHKFQYAAAWRIENPAIWQTFDAGRATLRQSIKNLQLAGGSLPKVRLRQALFDATRELPGELDEELNEHWLVHGTSPEIVLSILTQGFNGNFAGRGLFGKGTYFAEDAAKSDQYVTPDRDYKATRSGGDQDPLYDLHRLLYGDDESSHPQDVFYILLCRVLLGSFVTTKDGKTQDGVPGAPSVWSHGTSDASEARELAKMPLSNSGEPFHALLAEKGGRVVRYREFVTYHGETRCYPEYLIAYRRVPPRLP